MSDKYSEIIDFVKNMEADVEKFYVKGQAAAGTRVRKALSELKKLAQDMRNEVQDIKSERKG
jgi:ABC-type Zn uptake system ZnuABC Zn-binding protein ZnuA